MKSELTDGMTVLTAGEYRKSQEQYHDRFRGAYDWQAVADELLRHVESHLTEAHRAAANLGDTWGTPATVVFANDGEPAKHIEYLTAVLGDRVLAHASNDYSFVMLVMPEIDRETADDDPAIVMPDFDSHEAAELTTLVWDSWWIIKGVEMKDESRHVYEAVQRNIATKTLLRIPVTLDKYEN